MEIIKESIFEHKGVSKRSKTTTSKGGIIEASKEKYGFVLPQLLPKQQSFFHALITNDNLTHDTINKNIPTYEKILSPFCFKSTVNCVYCFPHKDNERARIQ